MAQNYLSEKEVMDLLMKSSDEEDNIFSDEDMDAPGPFHNRSTPRVASSEN